MSDDAVPERVAHFRVVRRLGAGGMGIVYEARDEDLQRTVALKLLPAAVAGDEDRRRRMLREARSAAAVTHPNIATVYEVGADGERLYVAMEYVQGETLRAILESQGRLEPLRALHVARGIARGLARAHERAIVHRDLKPENVMLDASGEVKILDFGLAKPAEREVSASTMVRAETASLSTAEGVVVGTPQYMSPEQALGRPVDVRCDVFAFGVVLYELLTGVRPFRGATTVEVIVALTRDAPEPPSKLQPRVTPELERVVMRCLEKAPADRFADGSQLLRALEGLESSSASAVGAGSPAKASRKPRVSRRTAALAALAALVVGSVAWMANRPAPASHVQATPAPSTSAYPRAMTDLPLPEQANKEALAGYVEAVRSLREGTGRSNPNLRRALALDPDFAAANLLLAINTTNREAFRKALAGRARLTTRDQEVLDAYIPRMTEDPPNNRATRDRLAAFVERRPEDAWGWQLLGNLEEELGSTADGFRAALAAFDRALALDPGFVNALLGKAGILDLVGDESGALAAVSQCLASVPTANNCLDLQSTIHEDVGACREAEADLRQRINRGTDYVRPYVDLASAILSQGESIAAAREALHDGETRMRTGRLPWPLAQVALAFLSGDFDAARRGAEGYGRSIQDSSDDEEHALVTGFLVRLNTEMGDAAGAQSAAQDYLARRAGWNPVGSPDDDVTGVLLAMGRGGRASRAGTDGKLEERAAWWTRRGVDAKVFFESPEVLVADGADDARNLLDLAERHGAKPGAGVKAAVHDARLVYAGALYLLAGRVDDAVPLLERAATGCDALLAPFESTRAHHFLGLAREAKGDTASACKEYGVVLSRWGAARPRSVTADKAKERARALKCAW
jgi:serine/threonine-protein kinase